MKEKIYKPNVERKRYDYVNRLNIGRTKAVVQDWQGADTYEK